MSEPEPTPPTPLPGFETLAPLEYVDASVFEGKDTQEQAVCDFILSLALIHNDLKDLILAFVEIQERCPKKYEATPQAGQLSGMREHCTRLLYAMHHELLLMIQKNPEPQKHQLFTNVVGRISRDAREHWAVLVAAAEDKPKDTPLAMILNRVRNDVAFHYYGIENLGRGFKKQYDGSGPFGRKLHVSRGLSMQATRFHFADGAAQGLLRHFADGKTKEEIGDRLGALTNATRVSTSAIVTRFMEDRGRGWSKE